MKSCSMPALSVGRSGRAATAARAGIHNHRLWLWIPGSRARSQACAGCVDLPALLAPRNDAPDVARQVLS
jgi:hypothetical protein